MQCIHFTERNYCEKIIFNDGGVFIIACPKSTYGAALPEPDHLDWIDKYPAHVRCLYVDGMREGHLIQIQSSFNSLKYYGDYEKKIKAALKRALRISNLKENRRSKRFKKVIRAEPGYEQFIVKDINPSFRYWERLDEALGVVGVKKTLPLDLTNLVCEYARATIPFLLY